MLVFIQIEVIKLILFRKLIPAHQANIDNREDNCTESWCPEEDYHDAGVMLRVQYVVEIFYQIEKLNQAWYLNSKCKLIEIRLVFRICWFILLLILEITNLR